MRKALRLGLIVLGMALLTSCTSQTPMAELPTPLQTVQVEEKEDPALEGKEEGATEFSFSFNRLKIVFDWF